MRQIQTIVILAAAAAIVRAQETPGPASTIRTETRLVLVDGVVVDRAGVPVAGLGAKDFRVWEDGREQTITGVSAPAPAPGAAHPINMLLFFDDVTTRTPDQNPVRDAARKFVDTASAGRRMAVAEFQGSVQIRQNLTDDPQRLRAAIGNSKASVGGFAASPFDASRNPLSGVPRVSADQDISAIQRRDYLKQLQTLARGMAGVQGRKALVLFSAGFTLTHDALADLDVAIQAFNRSNVAVYGIGMGFSHGAELLNALAAGTGGFVLPDSDSLRVLERIARENSQEYLLSYTPDKPGAGGACHNLKVAVNREGSEIRFRKSYCENKPLDLLTGTAAERDLESKLSAATPAANTPILASWVYTDANAERAELAIELPPAAFHFEKEKNRFVSTMNLVGLAVNESGGTAARFSDSVTLAFDEKKQVDAFLKRPGYQYRKQFGLASGRYNLRVAYGSGGNSASVTTPLSIDPWDGKRFTAGGLIISRSAEPASAIRPMADDALSYDHVPLVVSGLEMTPAARVRFQSNDTAYVYVEVLEPALATPGAVEIPITFRMALVDAKTGEIRKELGLNRLALTPNGKEIVPVAARFAVAGAGDGRYLLRATFAKEGIPEVVREVPIEVDK
jgi:VWFA-related protein